MCYDSVYIAHTKVIEKSRVPRPKVTVFHLHRDSSAYLPQRLVTPALTNFLVQVKAGELDELPESKDIAIRYSIDIRWPSFCNIRVLNAAICQFNHSTGISSTLCTETE